MNFFKIMGCALVVALALTSGYALPLSNSPELVEIKSFVNGHFIQGLPSLDMVSELERYIASKSESFTSNNQDKECDMKEIKEEFDVRALQLTKEYGRAKALNAFGYLFIGLGLIMFLPVKTDDTQMKQGAHVLGAGLVLTGSGCMYWSSEKIKNHPDRIKAMHVMGNTWEKSFKIIN